VARRREWARVKEEALRAVEDERDIGYLDPGISGILEQLNSLPLVATTSSCIGRVALVEGEWHWERDEGARIVYKTHGALREEDVLTVLARGYRNLWLKATGPILHMRTPSMECALHILAVARRAGFKHSGIISAGGPGGIVVELIAATQFYTPLILNGRRLVRLDRESLAQLVNAANETVREGRRRLEEFTRTVVSEPGACAGSTR